MNINLIYHVFYLFFTFLEVILLIYIVTSWFNLRGRFKEILLTLLEPIFVPVRFLLKHSIFNTPKVDMSPIIGFVIITFLQEIFLNLKG